MSLFQRILTRFCLPCAARALTHDRLEKPLPSVEFTQSRAGESKSARLCMCLMLNRLRKSALFLFWPVLLVVWFAIGNRLDVRVKTVPEFGRIRRCHMWWLLDVHSLLLLSVHGLSLLFV